MKTVGAFEAKTHLAQLLDEVAKGERITITRHGAPVAQLVPMPDSQVADAEEAMRQWIEYRDEHDIRLGPGIAMRELIEEGRRF